MGKAKLHFAGILIIIIIALAGVGQEDAAIFYASAYGFLALVSVIFVVSIPILAKVRSKFTLYLLGNRRWIGIYTFVFAIIHFVVVMHFFFSWDFSSALNNTYRFLGLIALLILAAMTATSTNTAMRKMGRNWKRLHYLVYVALVVVIIHSFNLGLLVLNNNTTKTAVVIIVIIIISWKIYVKFRKNAPKAAEPQAL